LIKTIPALAAGGAMTYSFDYTAPVCGSNYTSTVTANGRDASGPSVRTLAITAKPSASRAEASSQS